MGWFKASLKMLATLHYSFPLAIVPHRITKGSGSIEYQHDNNNDCSIDAHLPIRVMLEDFVMTKSDVDIKMKQAKLRLVLVLLVTSSKILDSEGSDYLYTYHRYSVMTPWLLLLQRSVFPLTELNCSYQKIDPLKPFSG